MGRMDSENEVLIRIRLSIRVNSLLEVAVVQRQSVYPRQPPFRRGRPEIWVDFRVEHRSSPRCGDSVVELAGEARLLQLGGGFDGLGRGSGLGGFVESEE